MNEQSGNYTPSSIGHGPIKDLMYQPANDKDRKTKVLMKKLDSVPKLKSDEYIHWRDTFAANIK